MAPRAVWKGQIRLSLVSIPVELYSATTSSSRVSFRQIHEPTGKPVRYQKTVDGVGPIDTDEIVKGYKTDDGEYVLLDPDEIDDIKLETKKTLELVQFVGQAEIPPLYFDKPYYVVPTDDLAQDAYRVVRDALRQAEKVGLGQMTMRGKEYLVAIRPCGDGLLLETLHYADEIRAADPMFREIKDAEADDEMLELARSLIDKKTRPFDAEAFSDSYAEAMDALLNDKLSDKTVRRVETEGESSAGDDGDKVVDLMSALKKSVDASDASKKKTSKKTAS